MNSYEASQTSVQETQEAYEDINIDDIQLTDLNQPVRCFYDYYR